MSKFKQVMSWIFTVAAYLAFAVVPLVAFIGGESLSWITTLLIGLAAFIALGTIGHFMVNKYHSESKANLAVWIISFPPYIGVFVLLLALMLIVKFIDIMIYLFTGGEHGLGSVLNFLTEAAGFKKKPSSAGVAYTVVENGYERVLILVETKQDADPDSPLYTRQYNRFRDDVGNYWRSYDNNETFTKETAKQRSQGY